MEQPCPQCGHYVVDTEEFCPNPSCGAYLGWHREGSSRVGPEDAPGVSGSRAGPREEPGVPGAGSTTPVDDQARDGASARTSHVASLSPLQLEVEPGDTAELTIEVTNTGTLVDEVQITVVSDLAMCTTVTPPAAQVYPGEHAAARVTVSPSVDDGLVAGGHPLRLRLVSARDQGDSELDAVIVVGARVGMTARLVPPQTSGRSVRFRHTVELENHGNTPVHVTLQPRDDYGRIRWPRSGRRPTVVPPGGTGAAELTARTPRNWWGDTDVHPFEVTAHGEPEIGDGGAAEQRLAGRRDQEATLSGWHVWALMVTILAVLLLLLLPFGLALLDRDGGGEIDVEVDESGQVTLGDFIGFDVDQVTNELEAEGLEVAQVEQFSDQDVGVVLSQDPSAGTTVASGSTVTLVASAGESPDAAVCSAAAEAQQLLADEGLSDESAEAAREVVDSASGDGVDGSLVALAGAVSAALDVQDGTALDTALEQMVAVCGQ